MKFSTLASLAFLPVFGAAQVIKTCKVPKTFALTFDDGASFYPYGKQITAELEKHKAKGTFFINGNNYGCIYDYADELIARHKAGHQIASHTWSHVHVDKLTEAQLTRQLQLVDDALSKIIGVRPRYFRPPEGVVSAKSLAIIKKLGYKIAGWDLDSNEWRGYDAQTVIRRTYQPSFKDKSLKPHIALNHETKPVTVQVMKTVVPQLIKAGYKLVTVAECLGDTPYRTVGKPGKRDKTWTCKGSPLPGKP